MVGERNFAELWAGVGKSKEGCFIQFGQKLKGCPLGDLRFEWYDGFGGRFDRMGTIINLMTIINLTAR